MEHVITLTDSREPDRTEPADDDGSSPAQRLADLLRVEHIDRYERRGWGHEGDQDAKPRREAGMFRQLKIRSKLLVVLAIPMLALTLVVTLGLVTLRNVK